MAKCLTDHDEEELVVKQLQVGIYVAALDDGCEVHVRRERVQVQ